MVKSVLITTPDPAFGEFIRQTLAATGRYRVFLAHSVRAAVQIFAGQDFILTLLDADLAPAELALLGRTLNELDPQVPQVVLCSQNVILPPEFAETETLSKPFYLPDLLALLERVSPQTAEPGEALAEPGPPSTTGGSHWLEDVQRAAQHLTRLSLASAAQAALIVRAGALWAYAGQLSQAAALELSRVIVDGWDSDPDFTHLAAGADLARFVHLETTGEEYMLYATRLAAGMVLALAFEAATPLSRMRTQANKLARSLAASPDADLPANGRPLPLAAPFRVNEEDEILDGGDDLDLPLTPLFEPGFVPPPTPTSSVEWIPEQDLPDLEPHPFDVPAPAVLASPAEHPGSTRPAAEAVEAGALLETPAGRYRLSYACALVPRLSRHELTGELGTRLPAWLAEIFAAYEWHLDHLVLRPQFLLWVARLAPETAPRDHEQTVRRLTSTRIFSAFPYLAAENPSGDFWSAGSLMISAAEPPPEQVVADFAAGERTRQAR